MTGCPNVNWWLRLGHKERHFGGEIGCILWVVVGRDDDGSEDEVEGSREGDSDDDVGRLIQVVCLMDVMKSHSDGDGGVFLLACRDNMKLLVAVVVVEGGTVDKAVEAQRMKRTRTLAVEEECWHSRKIPEVVIQSEEESIPEKMILIYEVWDNIAVVNDDEIQLVRCLWVAVLLKMWKRDVIQMIEPNMELLIAADPKLVGKFHGLAVQKTEIRNHHVVFGDDEIVMDS